MIPIDFQVSRSKVKVKGHVGEGGISVSQTSIFNYFLIILSLSQDIDLPRLGLS